MPKKPTPAEALEAASIHARPMIRDVLKAAKRPLTVDAIIAQTRRLDPAMPREVIEAALEWNMKRGNVNFEHNAELEVDLWDLTTRGRQA